MFQSAHGSAPDIAGQNVANPIAEILSGAMMLRWLGERHEDRDALKAAEFIDTAVAETLASGDARTRDLGGSVGTRQAGQAIASRVEKLGR
jgi:3-isopropylmalate dehydrogenase